VKKISPLSETALDGPASFHLVSCTSIGFTVFPKYLNLVLASAASKRLHYTTLKTRHVHTNLQCDAVYQTLATPLPPS
jgi:hypothetical protein